MGVYDHFVTRKAFDLIWVRELKLRRCSVWSIEGVIRCCGIDMEAASGIEPLKGVLQAPALTTWLRRLASLSYPKLQ